MFEDHFSKKSKDDRAISEIQAKSHNENAKSNEGRRQTSAIFYDLMLLTNVGKFFCKKEIKIGSNSFSLVFVDILIAEFLIQMTKKEVIKNSFILPPTINNPIFVCRYFRKTFKRQKIKDQSELNEINFSDMCRNV